MSLIRGIRSIIHEYSHDSLSNSEQNRNAVGSLILETSGDTDFRIKILKDWPQSITINTKLRAIQDFDKSISVEVLKGQHSFGSNQIYATPNFHAASEIKKKDLLRSKIQIILDGEIDEKISKDFKLQFTQKFSDKNVIFEKNFGKTVASFSEQYDSQKTPKLHLYGGFFRSGATLEEIESCCFQALVDNNKTALRILRLSKIFATKTPISDVIQDQNLDQNSLKDDLFGGKLQIILYNKNTNESCVYESDSAQKESSKDCYKIHLIKQENPK